jgi:hypothetical protein
MTTEDVNFASCRQSRRNHWDAVARKMDSWTGWSKAYHERLTQVYRCRVAPGQRILEVVIRLCFFMSLEEKKKLLKNNFPGVVQRFYFNITPTPVSRRQTIPSHTASQEKGDVVRLLT